MAETQLITISELSAYRKIDPKFNADRFNSFVNAVQRRNLRDLLGEPLYYDFMADARTIGKYKILLDGEDYTYNGKTIHFYGLKPAVIFWTLALIARESDMHLSQSGAISFVDNPQQQFQSAKSKEQIAGAYIEEATRYANEVIQYLDTKRSTYPLWDSQNETNESQMISFKI